MKEGPGFREVTIRSENPTLHVILTEIETDELTYWLDHQPRKVDLDAFLDHMRTLPSKPSINDALQDLVGQPWWGATRAASMIMFSFGPKHEHVDRHGRSIARGEIALHVQCPWRLSNKESVIVGSTDLAREPENPPPVTDRGSDPPTQADVALAAVLAESGPLEVSGAVPDAAGGLRIEFREGFRLELSPITAENDDEYWRLFRPDSDRPHMVVSARGVEWV